MMRAKLPAVLAVRPRSRLSPVGRRAMLEDLLRVADAVAVVASGLLAVGWRFKDGLPEHVLPPLVIGALLAANTLPLMRLYRADRLGALGYQVPRVLAGWGLAITVLLTVLFALKTAHETSRLWIGLWAIAGATALVANRLVLRLVLRRGEAARALVRRVAVVGLGPPMAELLRRLGDPTSGIRVSVVVDLDGGSAGCWAHGLAELAERVYRGELDGVVLAVPARAAGLLESALRHLRHLPVEVSWAPDLPDRAVPILGVTEAGDVPLVRLTKRPLDGWPSVLKAIEDRVLAALALLLLAPLMALLALAVRLDSPGPAFYRQFRQGFSKQPIAVLKFRTMHADRCDAADAAVVHQATRDDPRVTRVGRVLRRTSLDELPQLINVLRGEMSLVGPRPHALAHDRHYADLIDDYLGRHRVKPGITGWAQVNGYRGETRTVEDMRKRIELDLEYIDRWSILLDVRILWRTLFMSFGSRNAY